MKILFISPQSPELSVGGVERHVENLINYCTQKNKEVVFLLPAGKNEGREDIGNVTIIKKDFLNLKYKKFFEHKEIPVKEIKSKSNEFFNFVRDLLKNEKIEMVNVQNFHLGLPPIYSLMINMACFLEKVPMVVRIHSFIKNEMQKSLINDLSWEKILCVSKSVAGDCYSKGITIDRLHTQYLGVNRNVFSPNLDKFWLKKQFNLPKNSKIILHASRIISGKRDIIKEKGIITLIESFSQLSSKDSLLQLVIAIASPPQYLKGEFHYALEKIKGYTKLHNIEQRVFLKEFTLEQMPLVYNGSDLFVLASENETFGQVYIEAMSCGIPVIGTNVGGVPEIITDGFNGFLIAPGNPSNLVQKIEQLIYNDEFKNTFIDNGFKSVQRKFSSHRQFSNMFNYLAKLSIQNK